MKIINKVFVILLLATSSLFAQSDINIGYRTKGVKADSFVRNVTGAGIITAAFQAADGGYVTTSRIDTTTFLVRRVNDSGEKQWEKTLSFRGILPANFNEIAQTKDGGFVLVGELLFHPEDATPSGIVVRLHPDGKVAWKKAFAITGEPITRFTSVIATSDGGVIAIGQAKQFVPDMVRFLAVRFSNKGDVMWKIGFNSVNDTLGFDYGSRPEVVALTDGFIIADSTEAIVGNLDLTKISYSGSILWKKSVLAGDYIFQSIDKTIDNGVVLVGVSRDNALKLIKLKSNGTIDWKAAYSFYIPARPVGDLGIFNVKSIQTPDGGYAVSGGANDPKQRKLDGFILKIDSSRKVVFQYIFQKAFPRFSGQTSSGESVFTATDGGFVLFDSSAASDLRFIKLDSKGFLPGCGFLRTFEQIRHVPFGPLRIVKTTSDSSELTLEPSNFGLSSLASNYPESSACR